MKTLPSALQVCGKCWVSGAVKKLQVCTACRKTWYCGKECQTTAWQGHKRKCKEEQAKMKA